MTVFVLLCLSTVAIYIVATLLPESVPVWQVSKQTRFALSSVFILLTLAVIPLSLRLFKFRFVAHDLILYKEKSLLKWGLLRMAMLGVLLLVNLLLYYLLEEEPTFGWLALILLLVLPFIVPTQNRCEAEVEVREPEESKNEKSKEA